MYQPSQFEVLRVLRYPLFARTELVESAIARLKQGTQIKPKATAQEVLKNAQRVSQTGSGTVAAMPSAGLIDSPFTASIGLLATSRLVAVFDCPRTDSNAHRKLVENMLVRCGCCAEHLLFEHFGWPVVASMQVQQGRNEAARALKEVIARMSGDLSWMILCGTDMEALPGITDTGGELVRIDASVAKMLSQPQLRRQAWESLAPFREALQAKDILRNDG